MLRLQVCQRPFKVSDTYTAPKGSLLMPSIIAANMQVRWFFSPEQLYYSWGIRARYQAAVYAGGWHGRRQTSLHGDHLQAELVSDAGLDES